VQHQGWATSVASSNSGASNCNKTRGNNYGGAKGKSRNNNRKGNKNQGGGNRNSNQTQHQSASKSVPARTVYDNTVFSWSSIQCSSPSRTNIVSAGNNSSKGVLGSHPTAVCQICFAPGHTTIGCPQHYIPSQSSSVPTFATFNAIDANESVWYPNSAAASHMVPDEGSLLTKSVYSGIDCVRVGN